MAERLTLLMQAATGSASADLPFDEVKTVIAEPDGRRGGRFRWHRIGSRSTRTRRTRLPPLNLPQSIRGRLAPRSVFDKMVRCRNTDGAQIGGVYMAENKTQRNDGDVTGLSGVGEQ